MSRKKKLGRHKKPGPKHGSTQTEHLTKLDRVDQIRHRLTDLAGSNMVQSMRESWELTKSGMGEDISIYLKAATEAANMVHKTPAILDKYAINIDSGTDRYASVMLSPIDQILYYRANPWLVAIRVIGIKNLNKATALASQFRGFDSFQKQFLRDALDPRKKDMIFTACRSAGKTWLTSLAMMIMVYLIPSMRVMIVSGSKEQSDNLYRYFIDMIANTYFMRLVKGDPLKTRTETIAGGWVRAFPASHKAVHGPRPDIVICDEACKADSDIILAAFSAAMSAQDPKFIVMSTPDSMVHVFYDWLVEAWDQQKMTPVELSKIPVKWTLYERTAFQCRWITQDAIDNLTYMYGGKNTHEYKIYVLGQPAPAEGLVFDEELIHEQMIKELPKTVRMDFEDEMGAMVTDEIEAEYSFYTTGLDAGGKHPSAIVDACEDQVGNVYIIGDEEIRARMGDDPIIDATYVHARENWSKVWADAAPVQYFLNRKLRKKLQEDNLPGLSILPFNKFKGPMISATRGLLEARMLFFIKRKCERLLNQLLTYSYSETEGNEMPQKGDDDHVDAFMCTVWPHRNTYLNRKYKKATNKVYNLDEHLEEINRDPFLERPIELTR